MDKHEWKERPGTTREARGIPVVGPFVEPAWDQCARCGVSRGAAEHFGWEDCRPPAPLEDVALHQRKSFLSWFSTRQEAFSFEKHGTTYGIYGPLEEGPEFDTHDIGLPGPRRRLIATVYGEDTEDFTRRMVAALNGVPGDEADRKRIRNMLAGIETVRHGHLERPEDNRVVLSRMLGGLDWRTGEPLAALRPEPAGETECRYNEFVINANSALIPARQEEPCSMTFDTSAGPAEWRYCPSCGRPIADHASHAAARLRGEEGES